MNGSYYWDCNKPAASVLPDIRQAFLEGDDELAGELTRKNFGAVPEQIEGGRKIDRFGYMTTLGELLIDTGLREGSRPLDFDKAPDKVNYGGVATIKKEFRPDVKSGPGVRTMNGDRSRCP